MSPLVPDPDPIGLPAPAWLLKALLVGTFVLHLVPMNLTLGGGILAAWSSFRGRRRTEPGEASDAVHHRTLAAALARLLPVTTAFTITLGIAPLLFLQVLYGQLFYTSSVLMAWSWLAVVALLLAAYYGFYGFAFGERLGRPGAVRWAVLSAVLLLVIGFLFTHNLTLMLRPQAWAGLYAASEHGLHLNFGDPTLLPRFLHFVLASVAVAGLGLVVLGRHWERTGLGPGAWTRRRGRRLFVIATGVQSVAGLWLLLFLAPEVRGLFLGGRAIDTAALWGSVAAALLAVAVVGRRVGGGLAALGVTLLGMAYVRHRVRDASLLPHFSTDGLAVRPQTAVFVLFFVVLLAGLAVVAWMVARLARPGRSGG
jgi:hypothetical protein